VKFIFANHVLDTDRRELHRGSEPIAVEPQVFDLLVYLVQNRDRVVSKDDLTASVWGGRIVSDSTLTSRINAARKAVGDSGVDQKLIRTIARKGLRFVGAVRTHPNGAELAHAAGSPPDETVEPSRSALPLPDRPAIAVLPFINMSGDPEQEYFSDGISEDIITALSKLRWFFVIARNSSFIYKGNAIHMKQVAEKIGDANAGDLQDVRPAKEVGLGQQVMPGAEEDGGALEVAGHACGKHVERGRHLQSGWTRSVAEAVKGPEENVAGCGRDKQRNYERCGRSGERARSGSIRIRAC
jgi:DNA-binding winged helix-turn-helix (wHTH) protein